MHDSTVMNSRNDVLAGVLVTGCRQTPDAIAEGVGLHLPVIRAPSHLSYLNPVQVQSHVIHTFTSGNLNKIS